MAGPFIPSTRGKQNMKSYTVQSTISYHLAVHNVFNGTLCTGGKTMLTSLTAQLHLKICMLFSSCNPRELPLCVSLSFLPSGRIYGYGHCFCRGNFVQGGCRCLPHTKIKLQDSHTAQEKPRTVGSLMRGCILETRCQKLLVYTVKVVQH